MARVKRGVAAHARHKKVLKLAKGYRGRAKVAFRVGIEKVEKGLQYDYRDRRSGLREKRGSLGLRVPLFVWSEGWTIFRRYAARRSAPLLRRRTSQPSTLRAWRPSARRAASPG